MAPSETGQATVRYGSSGTGDSASSSTATWAWWAACWSARAGHAVVRATPTSTATSCSAPMPRGPRPGPPAPTTPSASPRPASRKTPRGNMDYGWLGSAQRPLEHTIATIRDRGPALIICVEDVLRVSAVSAQYPTLRTVGTARRLTSGPGGGDGRYAALHVGPPAVAVRIVSPAANETDTQVGEPGVRARVAWQRCRPMPEPRGRIGPR